MMTESEFLQHSDGLFAYIEDQIDEQIIVNRHTPNQELWIAAKSGGYHFAEQGGRWLATRDGREFFAVLSEALSAACEETASIEPFEG